MIRPEFRRLLQFWILGAALAAGGMELAGGAGPRVGFALVVVAAGWGLTLKIFADPLHGLLSKIRKITQSDAQASVPQLLGRLSDLAQDASRGRQAEVLQREELSALMAAISDAVLAVDASETILFSNSRFATLFREPSGGSGRKLWEVFREASLLETYRKVLAGQGRQELIFGMETDGGRSFLSLSVAPLKRPGGGISGAVGIFHDVTELKRAEQIRIDFVANVSHELRTPLTAIKGFADTVLQDVSAGKMPEKTFVETIERNSRRLMSLISDLLDLSSLESSDTLHPVSLDLREFTDRVTAGLKPAIVAKSQTLEVRAETPTLTADPKRLEQVLLNLLENAHKYTPPGSVIRVTWRPQSGGGIELVVTDNGPGIAEEHLARLFERFYRVDKGRSRDAGGTGLGLAIVKHIVQRHGGTVHAQSRIGEGTSFICRFPES